MKGYILVDFGSTYTKLVLIDENAKLVGKEISHTTIDTDIKIGYDNALKKLRKKVDVDKYNLTVLACSSAAGGLKMISVGITPYYTLEAAKRAALGAGASILKNYSYMLKNEDISEIEGLNPSIILLCGGTEGGNTNYILHNAKKLTDLEIKSPIIIAGNSFANAEIEELFKLKNKNYQITENVMPDTNKINSEPVREVIRKTFMKQITKAKGVENFKIAKILMPTPTAVLKAAELLAKGTKNQVGFEEVMVIDIGGATTDVHSVSQPIKDKSFFYEGLEEPYSKRTVEGDLGMRYSAISLYENVLEEGFLKYGDFKDVYRKCLDRYNNPSVVSESEFEIEFDEAMAKICTNISAKRHCGTIRESYANGIITIQTGKDLRDIKTVIGTGGIISNSKNPQNILREVIKRDDRELLPEDPKFYVDSEYILWAVGLLSSVDEELALKVLIKNLTV